MKNADRWVPTKFQFSESLVYRNPITSAYGVGSRLAIDCQAPLYADLVKNFAKGKAVDLGCGDIPLYSWVMRYCDDLKTVDYKTEEGMSLYADEQVDLSRGLPFQESQFDTAMLWDVLEHLENPHQALGEIHRILKTNGVLIGSVPFYYWIHEEPRDFFRYTKFGLDYLFRKNGFKVLRLESYGGSLECFGDFIGKNLVFFPPLSILIQDIISFFSQRSWGHHLRKKTEHKFPMGYVFAVERVN